MHIPEYMLEGKICPVTAAVCAACAVAVAVSAVREKDKPSSLKFASISAFIFAAQMMNFPVLSGTSGHFLGTTLAVVLLGAPFGILSVMTVLVTQCLVFADGGLYSLGANILNMAMLGAVPGIILRRALAGKTASKAATAGMLASASFLSVLLASSLCSLELALSGAIAFGKVFPAMTGVHALVGLAEGLLTVALYALFMKKDVALPAACVVGFALSPLANGNPDGLERVAGKLSFVREGAPLFTAPLAGYGFPAVSNEFLATSLAGLAGVLAVFALSFVISGMRRGPDSVAAR